MDLLKHLDNMITTKKLLDNIEIWDGVFVHSKNAIEVMIEFAKIHVEAALKEASEKASVEYTDLTSGEIFDYTDVITDDNVGADVNKDSILNAYPLKNIK